jgi:hypothetical protein
MSTCQTAYISDTCQPVKLHTFLTYFNLSNSQHFDRYDSRMKDSFEVTNAPSDPCHFPSATRSLFVHDILQRTKFLHARGAQESNHGMYHEHEVGIDWLLHHKAFEAAFPLHDGHVYNPEDDDLPDTRGKRSVVKCVRTAAWSCLLLFSGHSCRCCKWVCCCRKEEVPMKKDRVAGVRTELGRTWAQFWNKTRPQPLVRQPQEDDQFLLSVL